MSRHYSEIAFTPAVRKAQSHYGSRRAMARQQARERQDPNMDALTDEEQEFIRERDSFYLATVSESGWPTSSTVAVRSDS